MPEIIAEKKKILIGVIVTLLVLGVVAMLFFSQKQKGELMSPFSQEGQKDKEGKEDNFLLWDDEAGFSFRYPDGLYIDDHPQDLENYAHLEITSTKEPEGKILILVNDAETETIDEWVEELEEATQASVLDTTLAGEPAKKLLFKDPKKVLTAAIDPYEGLFLLELEPGEGEYWTKVYDQILSGFAFKPLTEEEQAIIEETGGGGGNVIYEAEEVIE